MDNPEQNEKIELTPEKKEAGRRLLRHAFRYRKLLVGGITCTILATLLYNSSIVFLKFIIDEALHGENLRLLFMISGGIVGAFVLKGIFSYVRTMLITLAGMRVMEDMRNDAHKTILGMSLGYFEKQRTGELMSRLINDTSVIQMFVNSTIHEAVMVPVSIITCFGIVFYLSAKLTLLSLIIAPVIVVIITVAGRKMKKLSHVVMETLAELQAILWEILGSINVVKSFSMEQHELDRFAFQNRESVRMTMKQTKIRALYLPVVELTGAFCLAMVFAVGGYDVITKNPDFITGKVLKTGDIIALFMGLHQLFTQINRINTLNLNFKNALASAERVYNIIDLAPDIVEKPDAVELSKVDGKVEYKNVTFSYDSENPVLEDINVEILPGSSVALVGSSGAGKTTFIKLLMRFYDVTGGAILVDGNDLRDLKIASFRKHVAVVPQETTLFRTTIRSNIAYGRPGASDEEIHAAAKKAFAHDFISAFPDGYDTMVGERGSTLSGGQRQRVAIARAILNDPRILILDEATSNVDSVSEHYIQQALDKLMQDRTTFIIAHRLSTVRNADLILVMESGRIMERGTHDELYSSGGIYHSLYESALATEQSLSST